MTDRPRVMAGSDPVTEPTDDGVRWLALVIGEMLRTGLALLAKRFPEVRGASKCPKCGWRHS